VSRTAVLLERLAIGLASLALSVGLIALLSGYFAGRDQAGVSGQQTAPGVAYRDLGHRHLRPGQPRPAYDSNPPTSGAHYPESVHRDHVALNDDQVLQALELGDVVVFYPPPSPPAGLTALIRRTAPPFSPALAGAGQAVILSPRPDITGLVAAAWAHLLEVTAVGDPALRQFVSFWLGRGASSPCC
jgi:hypothetical protein